MDIHPEVLKAIPGAVGSAIALRWVEGSLGLKITSWAGGGAISYYGSEFIAWWMDLTHAGAIGFIGLALGLFGMICAGKVYELIREADTKAIFSALLDVFKRKTGG